jgi:hypothetical protein
MEIKEKKKLFFDNQFGLEKYSMNRIHVFDKYLSEMTFVLNKYLIENSCIINEPFIETTVKNLYIIMSLARTILIFGHGNVFIAESKTKQILAPDLNRQILELLLKKTMNFTAQLQERMKSIPFYELSLQGINRVKNVMKIKEKMIHIQHELLDYNSTSEIALSYIKFLTYIVDSFLYFWNCIFAKEN